MRNQQSPWIKLRTTSLSSQCSDHKYDHQTPPAPHSCPESLPQLHPTVMPKLSTVARHCWTSYMCEYMRRKQAEGTHPNNSFQYWCSVCTWLVGSCARARKRGILTNSLSRCSTPYTLEGIGTADEGTTGLWSTSTSILESASELVAQEFSAPLFKQWLLVFSVEPQSPLLIGTLFFGTPWTSSMTFLYWAFSWLYRRWSASMKSK